ncbi:hypothetical protein CYY_006378 [Polysphondylium violaceum]|uniref:TsaA-like domain-containing protein n=1 Tax=Polysphondylium violaceum TaxID=133409 RepID=A0A8J4UY87_9MYCE|nr:hypothetical protein CYY_006378 [Polysphondylium violaceum]
MFHLMLQRTRGLFSSSLSYRFYTSQIESSSTKPIVNHVNQQEEQEQKELKQSQYKKRISSRHKYRITFDPIGYFESVFALKNGTPRQGSLSPNSSGKVKIQCSNALHMLRGLDEFSHAWLIFVFHGNDRELIKPTDQLTKGPKKRIELNYNIHKEEGVLPAPKHVTVRPPRLNGDRRGVFATRAPHRPIPIGLTMCQIERVENDTVYFKGVDLIDGTPIVDIKPYIHLYDSQPNATIPSWVETKTEIESVEFTKEALENIEHCVKVVGLDMLKGTESSTLEEKIEKVKNVISEVLFNEPRSAYRRKKLPDEPWGFYIDTLNIQCQVKESVATVLVVEDKYDHYNDLTKSQYYRAK